MKRGSACSLYLTSVSAFFAVEEQNGSTVVLYVLQYNGESPPSPLPPFAITPRDGGVHAPLYFVSVQCPPHCCVSSSSYVCPSRVMDVSPQRTADLVHDSSWHEDNMGRETGGSEESGLRTLEEDDRDTAWLIEQNAWLMEEIESKDGKESEKMSRVARE